MRIVLAEDSAVVRAGLVRLLTEAGHEVVAEAGDVDGLLTAVRRTRPDLVITDVRMPGGSHPGSAADGAHAARLLREEDPRLPILLLSQHVETVHSVALAARGGFGYLLKDRVLDVDEFLDAVRRVAAGGSALDPEVVASLVRPSSERDAVGRLTPREREVLALMAEGRSNQAIAAALWLTPRTVESHIRSLLARLGLGEQDGATDRRVAAVLAYLGGRV